MADSEAPPSSSAGSSPNSDPAPEPQPRRVFLHRASQAAMAAGLVAGYGTCGYVGLQYVRPRPGKKVQVFVTEITAMAVGDALDFVLPGGAKVAIARRAADGNVADFIALSSTCPHLGCKVFWQGEQSRFFCPCHNGAFDVEGQPLAGPPKAAGTPLVRYPLAVVDGLLYVEVDEETLS